MMQFGLRAERRFIRWPNRTAKFFALALAASLPDLAASAQDRLERNGRVIIIQPDLIRQNAATLPDELKPKLPTPAELAAIEVDSSLRHLAAQLGDPNWAVREDATRALLAQPMELETLCALLQDEAVDAEARNRLLLIFREQMLGRPRGAVGIRIDMNLANRDRIIIDDLLEDLPAREVLRVGDEITHLNGKRLTSWNEFVNSVQFKRPGERIKITVERLVDPNARRRTLNEPTQTVDVELMLGSATKLIDDRTGRPQNNVLIEQTLRDLIRRAEERYQPKRTEVFVPMTSPGASERDSEARRIEVIEQITRVLQKLQFAFERMQRDQQPVDEGVRRVWDQQLMQLEELAMEGSLSAAEQLDISRRIDMFRKILDLR